MRPAATPVSPSDSYAAATESLRSATKWLLTAAAAVGAVLVAGLQLSSVGALVSDELPRLMLALSGLALGLAGVGYMIWRASGLLSDEWILLAQLNLDDFERRINTKASRASGCRCSCWRRFANRRQQSRGRIVREIYDELGVYREELYASVATSPEDLYAKLKVANEATRTNAASQQGGIDAARVHLAARDVVQFANYRRTRMRFDLLRRELALATIPVVVGAVLFAVAQPPTSEKPAEATIINIDGGCPIGYQLAPTGPSTRRYRVVPRAGRTPRSVTAAVFTAAPGGSKSNNRIRFERTPGGRSFGVSGRVIAVHPLLNAVAVYRFPLNSNS